MKHDKFGGKRTNWLLIKHRDDAADDGEDGGGILAIDTSVASGRAMATIAAGEGKAPKPFMLGKGKAPAADAIWDSNKGPSQGRATCVGPRRVRPFVIPGLAPARTRNRCTSRREARATLPGSGFGCGPPRNDKAEIPEFVAPQLWRLGRQAAVRGQMDSRDQVRRLSRTGSGRAQACRLAHAQRARLDGKIRRHRQGRQSVARWALRRRDRRPRRRRQARFRRAAGGDFPPGEQTALVLFLFDLLHGGGADLRKLPLGERKARLAALLDKRRAGKAIVRFVGHFEAGRWRAVRVGSRDGSRGYRVETARCGLSLRAVRQLDQGQVPADARGRDPAAGPTPPAKFRSLLGGVFRGDSLAFVGRIGTGFSASTVAAIMPKLEAAARGTTPFDRKDAAARHP